MAKRFAKRIQTSGHRLRNLLLVVFLVSVIGLGNVYGHGNGSETFPPVYLDQRLVTLEVSSSSDSNNGNQQISIALIDFDSKTPLRDVTFLIKSEKGGQFLFEQEFKADNGFIVFNFVSKDNDSVILEEKDSNSLFGLLGLGNTMVHVNGHKLGDGGLYKLDVTVLTADGYSKRLDVPLVFNSGISIAQTSRHEFLDPNFGNQYIDVITYYDEISEFEYDPASKEIRFFMPFEWSESNINQTSVVHEEIVIPKQFGDLLVSNFVMYINGIQLPDDIVNVDDFFTEQRTVHFIVYQRILQNILENNSDQNGMNFVIRPDRDYAHLSSITDNGQFRVLVSWEPRDLKPNSDATILFDVTDIFLKNSPVATAYEFSMTQDDRIIFKQDGTSIDSKDEHNTAEFVIPGDVSGIVNLNFENLDNNPLAKSTIPIVIDRTTTSISLPEWFRSNALWWSQGQIDDDTFVGGIEYLIKNNIIEIPQTYVDTTDSENIPSWIKTNAAWWAEKQIDDETFVRGLEFLVKNGIIRI